MINKDTKSRIANAFRAMNAIGLSENKVKPVLKDLLKLYDKNWAYIEEENYRVLADTIFEREEADAVELKKKKNVDTEAAEFSKQIVPIEVAGGSVFHKEDYMEEEAHATEEPERPLKRLRRKYPPSTPESSVPRMPLVAPKEEPNELPETRHPNLSGGASKGLQPISPQISPREKNRLHLKEPNRVIASHALIKPKDEPMTDDMPVFAVPIAIIHPDLSNEENSSIGDGTVTEHNPSDSLCVHENERTDDIVSPNEPRSKVEELAMFAGQCPNLEITSSPFEEEQISLSCELVLARLDFHMPNHEKVLKLMEEKCLKSYKILNPNFSLTNNLMKKMARSSLKLGSNRSCEPLYLLSNSPATDSSNVSHLKKTGAGDEHPETDLENEENCSKKINPEIIGSLRNVVDIANGQEKIVITLVNEVNDEPPPSFYYIPKNVVSKNAYVNFPLARIGEKNCCSTCSGDCLSLSEPCACAWVGGGEFAYSFRGLVKEKFLEECISASRDPKKQCRFFCRECPRERGKGEDNAEPCKGHRVRKFIKECWWKCGCDLRCGNRVVQRGISCNLQVFMTPEEGKGWGLRTLVDLPKGAFVCEYAGEISTGTEFYDRVLRCPDGEKKSYPVFLDAGWGAKVVIKDEEALCLDAAKYGNIGRFINHRCYDSNLVDIPVEVETPDRHYYHLALFTTRKVNAMEELTWDYGIDFDDRENPVKAFHCQCGSKFCRDIKCSRTKPSRR